MKEQVRRIIIGALRLDELKPEDLGDHTNLIEELAVDSVDLLELAMTIEDDLGVKMPDDQPEVFTSLHTLTQYVEKHR
jgi:acyl carrier protein